MTEGELLERIATTLRQDIGPAVADEFPKTQAFMASVVLQKLGRQLDLAARHREASAADILALRGDLEAMLSTAPAPVMVVDAVRALEGGHSAQRLCTLVGGLYESREALGAARADAMLGRVRQALRADIDRRMEYAG